MVWFCMLGRSSEQSATRGNWPDCLHTLTAYPHRLVISCRLGQSTVLFFFPIAGLLERKDALRPIPIYPPQSRPSCSEGSQVKYQCGCIDCIAMAAGFGRFPETHTCTFFVATLGLEVNRSSRLKT